MSIFFCVALDIIIYLAPVKSPFPGERGQGDRDSKLEVCFKNRLFLQAESCDEMYVSPQLSDCRKTSFVDKKGVAGAEPPYRSSAICATASCSGFVWLTASILAWTRGGSPTLSPARTPSVYAQMLYARTHTSGRTKSVQDAPTTNDHDCTDAKPTKHTQPFTGERGFRQGCRNKDTPSFAGRKAIRVS